MPPSELPYGKKERECVCEKEKRGRGRRGRSYHDDVLEMVGGDLFHGGGYLPCPWVT